LTAQRPERGVVTRQQVLGWYSRRHRIDFPEKHVLSINGKNCGYFLLSEVLEWYDDYIPFDRKRYRSRRQ